MACAEFWAQFFPGSPIGEKQALETGHLLGTILDAEAGGQVMNSMSSLRKLREQVHNVEQFMDLHHELVAAEHVLKSLPNDMVLDLNGELSAQRGTNNESLGSFDFVVRSKKTGEPVRVIEVKSPRGRIGSVTDLYDGITHTKGKVQPVAGDGCQTQATVVVDLKKRWRT